MFSNSVKYQPPLNDLKHILTSHIKQIIDSIIEDYNQNFKTTENLYSLCNNAQLKDNLENDKLSRLVLHPPITECLTHNTNVTPILVKHPPLAADGSMNNLDKPCCVGIAKGRCPGCISAGAKERQGYTLEQLQKSIECLNLSIITLNDKVNKLEGNSSKENIKLEISEITKQFDNVKCISIPTFSPLLNIEESINGDDGDDCDDGDDDDDDDTDTEEDDGFELFEVVIDGVTFCTNNEMFGDIYGLNDDESQGEKVGCFKNGIAAFNSI
jgi:hypothetical protein